MATPSMILRGRGKRRVSRKAPDGAVYQPRVRVWIPNHPSERFDHPVVEIRWCLRGDDSDDAYTTHTVAIKHQRGWREPSEVTGYLQEPSRGFLRSTDRYGTRVRTESYAPDLEAPLRHGSMSLRAITWTTELLASARERLDREGAWDSEDRAARALRRHGDELLVLIVSLQRLGLDVEIYNEGIHTMRTQRGRARRINGPEYYLVV